MNLDDHPEFQYADPEDLAYIEASAKPAEWPSSVAARVGRSVVRYTRESVEKNQGTYTQEQRELIELTFDANLEALKELESKGDTPVSRDWARYLEELSNGCNVVLTATGS